MKRQFISTLFLGASLVLVASVAHAKPKSWVELSVATPKTQYVTGAPIDIVLNAKNMHSAAAYLHFSSGQRYDLQLFRKGGSQPVYTWSATRMFNMMVGQLRLSPGQQQNFEAQIGDDQGALVPGKYELRAHLTNSSRIEAKPVELEIVASPVKVKTVTNKAEYNKGEPVKITLAVSNNSDSDKIVNFGSGQTFDVFVKNEAGEDVWNWSANKRFIQVVRDVTFKANSTQEFSANWNGLAMPDRTVTPGTYTIQAYLTSNPRVYAEPVRITVK